jgi:hypothetical protein
MAEFYAPHRSSVAYPTPSVHVGRYTTKRYDRLWNNYLCVLHVYFSAAEALFVYRAAMILNHRETLHERLEQILKI